MAKIYFKPSTKKFSFAEYAVSKDGEAPADAVMRSITRSTGFRVGSIHVASWTEDKAGKRTSQLLNVTLTNKTQSRSGGGYGVVGEFRVTVRLP